jgi:hypothetical protein
MELINTAVRLRSFLSKSLQIYYSPDTVYSLRYEYRRNINHEVINQISNSNFFNI